jgi:uncharacterized membrane-anchored protein
VTLSDELYIFAGRLKGALAMLLLSGAALVVPQVAQAQLDAIRSEFSAALSDAQAAQKSGPALIPLLDEATLQIPADYVFVPMPAAARLLKAMGNPVDPHLVGVVFPGHDQNWLMVVQFEKTGFIHESDASDWNVDDLLKSVREGTERGNLQRKSQGLPEIEITGWAEKPRYDAKTHRLVWAVAAHDRGAGSDKANAQGVNYNTYVLGRDGYFKFNLVTDLKDLPAQQAAGDAVVATLAYVEGKRYTDFDSSSDPVADFTITSLVAGIAVKKLGTPAVLAAVVAKFSLSIIAATIVVLIGLLCYLWLRRRARKKARSDDFPPTEIAPQAMDGPTLVMVDQATLAGGFEADPPAAPPRLPVLPPDSPSPAVPAEPASSLGAEPASSPAPPTSPKEDN